MKVNIKNSSSIESNKLELINNFFKFCQENSKLKKDLDFVLVDNTDKLVFNNKYYIICENITTKETLKIISEIWIKEFSTQNKIEVSERESSLMVEYFFKKFPNYNFV
jgi:hypothetical protein